MSECGQFRLCTPELPEFNCYWCVEDIADEELMPPLTVSGDSYFDNATILYPSMPSCIMNASDVKDAVERLYVNKFKDVTYRPNPADGASVLEYRAPYVNQSDPNYTGSASASSEVWNELERWPKNEEGIIANSSVLDHQFTFGGGPSPSTGYFSAYMQVAFVNLSCSGDRMRGRVFISRMIRRTTSPQGSIDTDYFTSDSFFPSGGGGSPVFNDRGQVDFFTGYGGTFDAPDTCEDDGLPTAYGGFAGMTIYSTTAPRPPVQDVTPPDIDNFKIKFEGI